MLRSVAGTGTGRVSGRAWRILGGHIPLQGFLNFLFSNSCSLHAFVIDTCISPRTFCQGLVPVIWFRKAIEILNLKKKKCFAKLRLFTPATVLSNSFWVSWASSRGICGQNEHIQAMVQGSRFPGCHAHCLTHGESSRALPPRGYEDRIVLPWTHPAY